MIPKFGYLHAKKCWRLVDSSGSEHLFPPGMGQHEARYLAQRIEPKLPGQTFNTHQTRPRKQDD